MRKRSKDRNTAPGVQGTEQGRVARDHARFGIHRTKTTKALLGGIGGLGAFGAGGLARQLTEPQPPPVDGMVVAQDLPASATQRDPGALSVEAMKEDLRRADAAIMADPHAKAVFEATLARQGRAAFEAAERRALVEFLAGSQESQESQAQDPDIAAARAGITEELKGSPLTVDLSVDAAAAFAATLLLDILKEARRRFVARIVDHVVPEHAPTAEPPPDAAIRQALEDIAACLREQNAGGAAKAAAGEYPTTTDRSSNVRDRPPDGTGGRAERAFAAALDEAQGSLAQRLRSRRPAPKYRGEAARLAAAVRLQADALIARGQVQP